MTTSFTIAVGSSKQVNTFIAELSALSLAVQGLASVVQNRRIQILLSNLAALQAVANPAQQSGQHILRDIYRAVQQLREKGNQIAARWIPTAEELPLRETAKSAARAGTAGDSTDAGKSSSKATVLSRALQGVKRAGIPKDVGKYTTDMDRALPGRHVRQLYDSLTNSEASILAQLRTGMARLNGYLYRIGVAETEQCRCGGSAETTKHFLFRCSQWDEQRRQLFQNAGSRRGCLSFFLGGRAPSDQEKDWKPNMAAVRAVIKYAAATERLKWEPTELQQQ